MRINDRITGINGVAAGGVATAELPTGRRYHGLTLYYKTNANQATIEADISFIRLSVNGILLRDIRPAELFIENTANGRAFVAGEIPIFFSEPWRATVMEEQATSWDMYGQGTFTVDIGIAAGAVAPTIDGISTYDYQRNDGKEGRPGANIVKWIRNTFVFAAAGDLEIKTLPKGMLHRVTLFGPASAPTAVRVEVNSKVQMDLTLVRLTNLLAKYGITAQALTFPAYYDYTQQIIDALPVGALDDYNMRVTSAGAQNVVALTQVRVPGYM